MRLITASLSLVVGCRGVSHLAQASPPPKPGPVPVPWCVVPGTNVDSAFAVAQARSILESPALPLTPYSVEPVVAKDSSTGLRFGEGFLVRLMPVNRNTLGGGGLVWVNGGTGCPILLIQYE